MSEVKKKIRALGLCSGGLDSMLSGLVLRSEGIDVTWITFITPFFGAENARKASKMTGIPLIERDITDDYLVMLKNPPGGYGKNMNPCRDCHSMMFRFAGEFIESGEYDFLFSGEVAGQRPLSQTKNGLRYVEKHSGFDGYVVRPLSAKILPETLAEKKGLIQKDRLLDISGRSRKRQIKLAREYGITDFPAPAGGCHLTDKNFSVRLKDVFKYKKDSFVRQDFELLKNGRHFRLNPDLKFIVGRDQKDNECIISNYDRKKDILIELETCPAPDILVPGGCDLETSKKIAAVCIHYSKADIYTSQKTIISTPEGKKRVTLTGEGFDNFKDYMVV